MKYVNSCGTLCVSSKRDCKFVNFMAAVMAMNVVQVFYANLGFSVNSSIYRDHKRVEVRIHFDTFDIPSLPAGYLYSGREITSQSYSGYSAQPCDRCRVVGYTFDF